MPDLDPPTRTPQEPAFLADADAATAPDDPIVPLRSASEPVAPAPQGSFLRRRGLSILIAGAIAVGTTILIGVSLTKRPPSWWHAIDTRNPDIIATAERVENGAVTQLTKIRQMDPDGAGSPPWTIALRAEDANAWLATRLRPWLESQDGQTFQWPKELGQVQVHFDGGRIHVGASMVSENAQQQVLAASIEPQMRSDGGLWLPAKWISLGQLNIPPSWVLKTKHAPKPVTEAVPDSVAELPQAREFVAALAGKRSVMATPIVRTGDGRRVRIMELRADGGVLYITCQTLPRETSRAGK